MPPSYSTVMRKMHESTPMRPSSEALTSPFSMTDFATIFDTLVLPSMAPPERSSAVRISAVTLSMWKGTTISPLVFSTYSASQGITASIGSLPGAWFSALAIQSSTDCEPGESTAVEERGESAVRSIESVTRLWTRTGDIAKAGADHCRTAGERTLNFSLYHAA